MRVALFVVAGVWACALSSVPIAAFAAPPGQVQVLTAQEETDAAGLAASLASVARGMPKASTEPQIEANLATAISQSGKSCKVTLAALHRVLNLHLHRQASAAVHALEPATARCAVSHVGGIGDGPTLTYVPPGYSGGGLGSDYRSQ